MELDDNATEGETVEERRTRETRVETNPDDTIPLIPNVQLSSSKAISYIQVERIDGPESGVKGQVPPNTNLAGVHALFGNGIYNFHACNERHKVLRRNDGIRISYPAKPQGMPGGLIPTAFPPPDMKLMQFQHEAHLRENERLEKFGQMAIETTRQQGKESSESAQSFMKSAMDGMQTFFGAMLKQSDQTHTQAMERQREEHRQWREQEAARRQEEREQNQANRERERELNNPMLFLALFREGIQLGQHTGESPEDPMIAAMKYGVDGLKEIGGMVRSFGTGPKTKGLPGKQQNPATPQQGKAPANGKVTNPARSGRKFTQGEVKEMARVAAIVEQKGMDLETVLRQAGAYLAGVTPDDGNQADGDEPEPDDESDSEDSDESDDEDDSKDSGEEPRQT